MSIPGPLSASQRSAPQRSALQWPLRQALLNRSAALALLESLAQAGLQNLVLSPGSRSTPIALAAATLEERGLLQLHVVLDERAAAFFALGLCQRARSPVAPACTSGSAPGHYLPALLEAKESGDPLLVLSADRPEALRESGALQTTDQRQLFMGVTRYQEQLVAPEPTSWMLSAQRAWGALLEVPAQPVHLNLPFPEPLWEGELSRHQDHSSSADGESPLLGGAPTPEGEFSAALTAMTRAARPRWLAALPAACFSPTSALSAAARAARSDALFRLLSASERGLIRCGPLRSGEALARPLAELAVRLQWPVLTEAASQLRGHPALAAVELRRGGLLAEAGLLKTPGALLEIGAPHHSRGLRALLAQCTGPRLLASDRRSLANPDLCPALLLRERPERLLQELLAAAQRVGGEAKPSAEERLAALRSVDARVGVALEAQLRAEGSEGIPLSSGAAGAAVAAAAIAADANLQVSSSLPFRAIDRALAGPLARLYAHRGLSGIDGQIASAVGLAQSDPERPTLLWTGDLSFLHDLGALTLLQRAHPPLVILVTRNGGGGIFKLLPIDAHPLAERLFFTPHTLSPEQLAGSSLPTRALSAGEGLRAALVEALLTAREGGPQLLMHDLDPEADRAAWRALPSALLGRLSPPAEEAGGANQAPDPLAPRAGSRERAGADAQSPVYALSSLPAPEGVSR